MRGFGRAIFCYNITAVSDAHPCLRHYGYSCIMQFIALCKTRYGGIFDIIKSDSAEIVQSLGKQNRRIKALILLCYT